MIYFGNIGCIFISLYLVFGNTSKSLIAILVFGAGICSRILMGFIVTVFASGNRTQLIFIVMMIVLILMMLEKQEKKFNENVFNYLIIVGSIVLLNNIAIISGQGI